MPNMDLIKNRLAIEAGRTPASPPGWHTGKTEEWDHIGL